MKTLFFPSSPRIGALVPFAFLAALTASAQEPAAEKITYEDHVRPMLENKCFSCHNPDKKKGDLDLTNFGGLMTGGGGGAVPAVRSPSLSMCSWNRPPWLPVRPQ